MKANLPIEQGGLAERRLKDGGVSSDPLLIEYWMAWVIPVHSLC